VEAQKRRRLLTAGAVALVAVAALVIALTSSGGGSKSPQGAIPASSSPAPDPVQASRDQQAFEAQVDADQKRAQRIVDGIEAKVKATTSRDERLSIIITEYCRRGAGEDMEATGADSYVLSLLGILYEKYWTAGGKWNRPINSAAAQQGACPSYFTTPPPPQGPVG
jgi:hypothetical protein